MGCGSVLSQVRAPPVPAPPEGPPPVSARARYQYLVGRIAIEEADWEEAERALRTALLHDSSSPWTWLALADVAAGQGEEAEERRRVQEAVRLGPEHPEAWARLGVLAERAGDVRTAIEAYTAATDRGAGPEPWAALCRLLVRRDDPAAADTVRRWADIPLSDPAALRERGHIRLVVGDLAGAVADLGDALVATPADARLLDEYLAAVTGSGLYRQGLTRLELVRRAAPHQADVLLRTYHLAAQARDAVRAAAALEALDALSGRGDAQVKLWLADTYSTLGRHADALAALDAGAKLSPPIPDVAYHRARVLRAAGQHAAALNLLVIPKAGANRMDAVALRSRLLLDLGRGEEARTTVDAALRGAPDDYVLLGALATVCTALGDREGALTAVDRMAMLDSEARARTRARSLAGMGDLDGALAALRVSGPSQAESWIVGGVLLREAGRVEDAVAWLALGVDRHPGHAALRAELGLAQAAANRVDAALIVMREALGIDPSEPRAARFYARAVGKDAPAERLRQARGYLLASLERQPADPDLLATLGGIEYALRQPLRALDAWEESLRYATPDAALVQQLAATYREVGRTEDARRLEERYR
jgi:tetratricopeptide (TPR) repeat protein